MPCPGQLPLTSCQDFLSPDFSSVLSLPRAAGTGRTGSATPGPWARCSPQPPSLVSCCSPPQPFCAGPQPDPLPCHGAGFCGAGDAGEEGRTRPCSAPGTAMSWGLSPVGHPQERGAAFPRGPGSSSRPVPSHPVPSSLIPSHPTAHSGTPHRENHRHGPGQVGSQHARSRPCWQRGRGRPRGAPSSPPTQRAAGTGTSADPGGQGTCASCGRVSANAHSAQLLPGFAAVSGDDRAVPAPGCLFYLQIAGTPQPRGAAALPAEGPGGMLGLRLWHGTSLGREVRGAQRAGLRCPPESSPPSGPRGPCTGEPSTLLAAVALGTPGHRAEAGPCQAASLQGSPKSLWAPWEATAPRMPGQGCQPRGFHTLLGTLGSRRLSRLAPDHPKNGGKEPPDSRPCSGSRNLPPISSTDVAAAARARRLGVGQRQEPRGQSPRARAGAGGGRGQEAPRPRVLQTLAPGKAPAEPWPCPYTHPAGREQLRGEQGRYRGRGSGWPGRALTPAPGQGTRPGARPQLLASHGSQAAGCSPAPATASAGGAAHIRTQLMAGIVL